MNKSYSLDEKDIQELRNVEDFLGWLLSKKEIPEKFKDKINKNLVRVWRILGGTISEEGKYRVFKCPSCSNLIYLSDEEIKRPSRCSCGKIENGLCTNFIYVGRTDIKRKLLSQSSKKELNTKEY